ncbi:MAG: sugar ABC transporter ATP-binding protein [Sphaerochaeta sp.]
MSEYELELRNISKIFPGVRALDDVSISTKTGEVFAICGENGAGKSTLMKIINGNYTADSGEIRIHGEKVQIPNPIAARKHGIAMIYQECNYIPELSVAESLYVGRLPVNKFHQVDWKYIYKETEKLLKAEGLWDNQRLIDGVHTKLKYLTIADIQMLEIVKAISQDSNILIMDEPTSSISIKEADDLLNKIRDLKKRGKCIIYISHKMEEIFKIADVISVFRDGKEIDTKPAEAWTIDTVIKAMVGRELSNDYPKETVKIGEKILEVKNLNSKGVFQDISFNLKAGEILGFAGLVGAGRTELARALNGLDPIDSGTIEINRKKVIIKNVKDSIDNGLAMLSEDRRRYGLIPVRGVRENIALPNLERYIFKGRLHSKKELDEVNKQVESIRIKTPSLETSVSNLSGGNQQKVVLAKWLIKDPQILILDEPTRGIDVGAKFEIYKLMTLIAKEGKGIIMISSEMPELLGMCDRIYVMSKGTITTELMRNEFSQETIMTYATGSHKVGGKNNG